MFHKLATPSLVVILMACGSGGLQRAAPVQKPDREPAAAIVNAGLVWRDVPTSPGEQLALLTGDPTRPGDYTLRRKFPPGHSTLPHWHPHWEYGTVISGVLYIGFGEAAIRSNATRLGPGGFIRVPPFTPHYTYADEEVVLQVHGTGPRKTYFVHEVPVPRH